MSLNGKRRRHYVKDANMSPNDERLIDEISYFGNIYQRRECIILIRPHGIYSV